MRRLPLIKLIDIPPVWLAVAVGLAWWIGRVQPFGLSIAHPVLDFLGGLCVGAGLLLMLMAVLEMRKARTTVIPHLDPDHLVTTGIFARSRNPIYLGDVLVLLGLILRWDAVLALPMVPVFFRMLETRFIEPEENRLRRKFRAEFARYCQKVRRWA